MQLKNFPDRYFGVEFEVGDEVSQAAIQQGLEEVVSPDWNIRPVVTYPRWAESINNDYWHVKYDSSCGATYPSVLIPDSPLPPPNVHGAGWEIASFKAKGERDLAYIANSGFWLGGRVGCRVNENCGFHIHADVSDFTPTQMGILMGRWLKIEPMLCKAVPDHRVNNKYCRLLCKSRKVALSKQHEGLDIWLKMMPTNFAPHENTQKKVTLNSVNYSGATFHEALGETWYKGKTIEFRMPEGTLDPTDVISWVTFFLSFIEEARIAHTPPNLLGVKNIRQFFAYSGLDAGRDSLLSELLFTTKLWFLKRFYTFGDDDLKNQIGRLQFG